MLKNFDIRILIFLAVNICYALILGILNSEFSPYIRLMLPAAFIIPPVFFLGFGGAMFVVVLSSIFIGAYLPIPFGFITGLWLLFAFGLRQIRFRFRALDTFSIICILILTNFFIILIYAFAFDSDSTTFIDYISRTGLDMAVSSLILSACGRFIVMLPAYISSLFGFNIKISDS